MTLPARGFLLLSVIAFAAGCSNETVVLRPQPPRVTPAPGVSPTPTAAGSVSPTPRASATATAAPSPTFSAQPTPTPSPGPSGTGSVACTAPAVTDGTYTSVFTEGLVTGNTYSDDGNGDWEAVAYTPATPTPTPTVTQTPAPSAVPTVTPTPAATPTPEMATIYFGEYTVSSYGGNALGGGSYTAAATNGCFFLILVQPVGGSAGQIHYRRPAAAVEPNADGIGDPNEPGTEAETVVDSGSLTSLSINNLTPTTGSGILSFTNGASNTATGTITITGSETETGVVEDVQRRIDALRHKRGALVIRARSR